MAKISSSTPAPAGVNAPTRRQLIGGSILAALFGAVFVCPIVAPDPGEALAAGVSAADAASPDAELLAACAAFDTLRRAYQDDHGG